MKKVYTADSIAIAWHFRNVLEQHGIDAVVKNDRLYSVGGEIPINECLPEVWVKQSFNAKYAESIIRLIENHDLEGDSEWLCEVCGESNFASFDICWNCSNKEVHD